jgi:hypothetical protein
VMAVMNKLSPNEDQILFLPKLKERPKPKLGEQYLIGPKWRLRLL